MAIYCGEMRTEKKMQKEAMVETLDTVQSLRFLLLW